MQNVAFSATADHPLAAVLAGQVGTVTANETRDGVAWIVAEFEGYGTVCLPESLFAGPMPPPPVADNPATPEDESQPGAWSQIAGAWRWMTGG